ncbi:cytochrome P450 2D14-like [Elgaria multicarinata webbii]|uniref:cytochrome P450 2D14-like n=1 Tax=Elgaria multicarinata webbii TaxID=159646 RepID=UPI002FCCE7B1
MEKLGVDMRKKNAHDGYFVSCHTGKAQDKKKISKLTQAGSLIDPHDIIFKAVGNIICSLTLGDRFEYTDETFLRLIHLVDVIMKGLTGILPQILSGVSWLSYLPGPHRKVQKQYDEFSIIIQEFVNEHKKTRDPTCPRDLIDAFLDEIDKAKGNPESCFHEQNICCLVFDLLAAGIETTSSTILWGLQYLVLYPEVQKRVQEEIDRVIGEVNSPRMEDQPNMTYTSAVIHEIQRYADVVPFPLPYHTWKDTEVGNFVIPKDTTVFNHLSAVLKDETMWEKPREFYPEHFLDANGKLVKREAFLPFSTGRHACPGEQLAKMELFIFMTSLLQHFSFCVPENCPRPKEERVFALTVSPSAFQISAIPR